MASSLNAYQRHLKFIHDYHLFYGKPLPKPSLSNLQSDFDIVKRHHRFINEDDIDDPNLDWERRLAKKYYDRLYKEYCLAELKFYKESKVAMRWRTEAEVVEGKGQFVCGALRCDEREQLKSWEVNFAYREDGERKNALVKLRLCPKCSDKLNYKKIKEMKREEKRLRREERRERKRKHKRHDESDGEQYSTDDDDDDARRKHKEDDRRKRQRRSRSRSADESNDGSSRRSSGTDDEQQHDMRRTRHDRAPSKEPVAESSSSSQQRDQEQKKEDGSNVWQRRPEEPSAVGGSKSKVDEFDEFFAGLFE